MTLPSPHAVIFDWDNTLVDTWPIIHKALNETFAQMGKPEWSLDDTQRKVRKSMRDSFPEVFGRDWEKAGKIYQERYRANHIDMLTPLPGAEETLALLQQHGMPTLVVSNKKNYNLREEVAHLSWGKYFAGLVGSEDASRDKPHPDPVHLALEYVAMEPHEHIWFVGDSEIDLETAANCGCTAILFGEDAPKRSEFSTTHYHGFPYLRHVHTHQQLQEILLPKLQKSGIRNSS